ncbi:mitotic checkpoint serine/threonine-protein kinase BUB1 isoform 1-T1 [Synchiropus picturatus]
MDVTAHLRHFEGSLSSYTGDDPLALWDRFVEYLEKKPTEQGGMWQVFDRLVERFLNVEQYANDIRFVNYCIRCASYYAEPTVLFSHVFSRGVGTRTASFYLAWAQDLERKGLREQADVVYKKAMENQAQPAETLLQEYRMFEGRARVQTALPAGRNPLQNSQLHNQRVVLREPRAPAELPSKPGTVRTIIITSRSEMLPAISGASSQSAAAYSPPGLDCDGSELCFEEVRAKCYFSKIQEQRKKEERENGERLVQQAELAVRQLQSQLQEVQHQLDTCPDSAPTVSLTAQKDIVVTGSGLRPAQGVLLPGASHCNSSPDLDENLNVSQDGAANLSHVTPNTSFGFAGATPSRVLPSPTVNTREALDLIMDMFQAPTLLSDTFNSSSLLPACGPAGAALTQPAAAKPFTIFQDEEDKENAGAEAAACANSRSRNSRVLAPIPVSRPGGTTVTSSDLTSEETTWGAGYNSLHSLAPCPNSTSDFAMGPELMSTPFTHKTPVNAVLHTAADTNSCIDGAYGAFTRRPSRKLSPIIEQSPVDDWFGVSGPGQQVQMAETLGTIVAEGSTAHYLVASSLNMAPPPALLSFRESLGTCESSRTAGSSWEVYTSPQCLPGNQVHPLPESSFCPGSKSMATKEDLERTTTTSPHPVGHSSQSRLKPAWPLVSGDPEMLRHDPDCLAECAHEPMSQAQKYGPCADMPMSPAQKSLSCADVPMSPAQKSLSCADVPMSPAQRSLSCAHVPMSPTQRSLSCAHVPMSPAQKSLSCADVPMSPAQKSLLCADVPMSPAQRSGQCVDVPMSPAQRSLACAYVPISPRQQGRSVRDPSAAHLVQDPWDSQLISDLLAAMKPPLSAHPHCVTWSRNIPNIKPKMTISIGSVSLCVDCILGEGAFAKVFQATDLMTSQKMVLKVQKPANPWEFYIQTQLDARLPAPERHLFARMSAAHMFDNGSVLLGDLHNCGTLLDAINLYRSTSDRVMPQPLVLYFTCCILSTLETLHRGGIVHADVKPDNFLLGQRFLDNHCLDPENLDHGLVLIDFGQSIDLQLFPAGTAFTAKCETSGFQCTEMLSGRPWNYQTDLFGIAGTVFCLLFGTYMKVVQDGGVWRTNATFRRVPHSELWLDLFHTLLNVPDCNSLPSLGRLHTRVATVLKMHYASRLPSLKNRLVVLLLEGRRRR